MIRQALECFEELLDGSWVCRKSTVITGLSCNVAVWRGQTFAPHTVFAGYDDFTSYLESISKTVPMIASHNW